MCVRSLGGLLTTVLRLVFRDVLFSHYVATGFALMNLKSVVFAHVFEEVFLRVKKSMTRATSPVVVSESEVREHCPSFHCLITAVITSKGTFTVMSHHVVHHLVEKATPEVTLWTSE